MESVVAGAVVTINPMGLFTWSKIGVPPVYVTLVVGIECVKKWGTVEEVGACGHSKGSRDVG